MSHAETCPVCHGSGKYTPQNDGMSTAVPMPQTCHGCGGKGWVELYDYQPTVIPTPLPNPVLPYFPPNWPWIMYSSSK